MLSHAGHLCMKDIVPETFLGHESALDGGQRCGDELSLGLELAPEGEYLGFEEPLELGRLTFMKFQSDCIRLRHGRMMDGFFTYHLSLDFLSKMPSMYWEPAVPRNLKGKVPRI